MGEGQVRGRPTGTVSFLFTDIEGSTPLWERHPDAMRAALERHDQILHAAIDARDGFVFSTAGDAFSAAFHTPGDAVGAALDAQQRLQTEAWPDEAPVRVRMGVHSGTVQERDGDYFGSVVNRSARLMGLASGGQVLVSLAVEELVRDDLAEGVGLKGLGEHALKGLSRPETVFQLTAPGMIGEFPALTAAASVSGNLPSPPTSFVGRGVEVAEVVELVSDHRLVTLTGVGGVGKTRLAVEVAAEVAAVFADGVWLVELAPVGDAAAVPDAVASVLGITPQPDLTVTASVARALSGRRLLIVLDNCEHVLDAAADLVEAVLAGAGSVTVLATSREGLRVPAEHLWPVPSLDAGSGAVELFVDRARAVNPTFDPTAPGVTDAVTEICRRLDGIALGIELAAARMVSMSAQDVRDRLDDRFRLLSGSRRGLERHQTLRHAVGWSFELLDEDERAVLCRCAVFADGFDVAAATHLCDGVDEYAVLDTLDSLVRKSLVTVDHRAGHVRYGMLETIRQYAEDQLAATGTIGDIRDRHARHYAQRAVRMWDVWNSPDQRVALDWVDAEFANLRAGFRWATDRVELDTAVAIAAHATLLAYPLQRLEPVGWAEEILEQATAAEVSALPRLSTAASLCQYVGRPEDAVRYARIAAGLEADVRFDGFGAGWATLLEAGAESYAGRVDRCVEVCRDVAAQPGPAQVFALVGLLNALPLQGRAADAQAMVDRTVTAARSYGNPFLVALALRGSGLAFAKADPARALAVYHDGLAYTRENRNLFIEALIARDAAHLEAEHGQVDQALLLFDVALDSLSGAGNVAHLAAAFAYLAALFDRMELHEIAATLYGTGINLGNAIRSTRLRSAADHLRVDLGVTRFDDCLAAGGAMGPAEAAQYARAQIRLARDQLSTPR